MRVKRRRHVDASVIPVGADESDILFCEIGFYMLEKDSQRAAAPFADPAPTLDTDMPGDLRGVRQLIEIVDRPRPLVADRAAKLQPVGGGIELRCLLFRIETVVAEDAVYRTFRISRCQAIGIEQPTLHPVVPERHVP